MFGSESLNLGVNFGGNIYGAAEHMKTISMNICNVCDYCDISDMHVFFSNIWYEQVIVAMITQYILDLTRFSYVQTCFYY